MYWKAFQYNDTVIQKTDDILQKMESDYDNLSEFRAIWDGMIHTK